MLNDNTPKQNGTIICWEETNGTGPSKTLHVPAAGSGETVSKTFGGSYNKIEMNDIPSASVIELSQGSGSGKRYIKLKTTHNTAFLNRTELQYLWDSYNFDPEKPEEKPFIAQGLGMLVIDKKGDWSNGDYECTVRLSKSVPTA